MNLRISAYTVVLATTLLAACSSSTSTDNEGDDTTTESVASVTPVGPVALGRPDTSMFEADALTEAVTEVDCTLSDGTETRCYRITIAGAPSNDTEGPYCPPNITSGAETAGSWFGENGEMVEVDGPWIKNLSTLYNDDEWQMYNVNTDEVHIQTGPEGCAITADPNPPTGLEFPSFCLECYLTDMGGGIERTILIPIIPIMTDGTTAINDHIGVSLNGVLFDRSAPLELIESSHSLGMLDDCGAHANPNTGYHYHAATDCAEIGTQADGHAAMVGLALDGFSIYANLDESNDGPGEVDECNGQTDAIRGYHYHAQPGGLNQTISCWKGALGSFEGDTDEANAGGGDTGGEDAADEPDFGAVAQALSTNTGQDISEADLTGALANSPPSCDDISGAAGALQITLDQLLAELPLPLGLECDF